MVKFQGKIWDLGITRNMSFFHGSFDVGGRAVESRIFGTRPNKIFYLVINGRQSSIFFEKESLALYYQRVEKLCSSLHSLNKLEKTYKKYGELLLKASDNLERDYSHTNYKFFARAYLYLTPGLFLTSAIGRHIHHLLLQRISELFPDYDSQRADKLVNDITYPDSHTPIVLSQISLLKIGATLQKNKIKPSNLKINSQVTRAIGNHLRLYRFIPVNFNEEPWSEQDILSQLRDLLSKNCAQELKKLVSNQRDKVRMAQEVLEKIKDKKIRLMSAVLQKSTLLNEYRKYCFCRASLAYRPLFREIAKKYNLKNWQECWKLTSSEIESLYYFRDRSIIKKISRRSTAAMTFDFERKRPLVHTGNNLKPFLKELNKKEAEVSVNADPDELNGTIANTGKVRGSARIIIGRQDFHKFKNKDILVTAMTSVDFVPLMERASAFVTNEGGITSHASIVSRELNKPCLIGTRIATQILKDGDFIEVDAFKGVVRILKRKR